MKRLLLIILVVICTISVAADTQVSISTSKMLGSIGDRIKITVRVITGADIDSIDVSYGKGEFEALGRKVSKPLVKGGNRVFEIVDEIAFFKTGDFSVGPGKVSLKKGEEVVESKETNSLSIKIKTTLTEKDKDIKPVRSPEEIEGNPRHLLIYAISVLAGVIVVLLIIYFIRRMRNKKKVEVKEVIPPIDEMFQRLLQLKGRKLIEKGKIKEYHLNFTSIIKDFLFRFYGFNAVDYTSFEIDIALRECESDGDVVDRFRYLMEHSDLIKFARMVPEDEQIDKFYKDINMLIDSLKKVEMRRTESEVDNVSAG